MTTKHGECCYCGRCGELHDDCRCDLDETVEELEQTKRDLAAARALWDAEHATVLRLVAERDAARAEATRLRVWWEQLRDWLNVDPLWLPYAVRAAVMRKMAELEADHDQ